jgi:hypothetical protein
MSLWGKRDSFALTGTSIAVTNASAAVVGTGTAFTTELQEGSAIVISGVPYKIYKITDDTHLTLVIEYQGVTNASIAIAGVTGHEIPKYLQQALNQGHFFDLTKIFFIDRTEAQQDANKKKGIHGGGWYHINEYVDAAGDTRYKTELLVCIDEVVGTTGDSTVTSEDLTASDSNPVITISVQPANQDTSGGTATFAVTASTTIGSMTYQWQKSVVGSTRWTNVSAATSSSLVLSSQTSANTGDRYRVVLSTTTQGAAKVYSDAATLTYVS